MTKPPHPFTFRDYRCYWIARLCATVAQTSMIVVIGWQVYDIARETMDPRDAAFQLGLIGIFQFLPLALLTLVVGWVADRIDRRFIVRVTALLEALCAAALATMAVHHDTTLPALFAIAALLGVARAFANPAMGALSPNLVPAEVLPQAIAVSSVSWQTGAIVGPALGGYLYAAGTPVPYTVAACLFLTAFAMLMLIRPIARTSIAKASPIRQMIDGLHYVRRNKMVLGTISLDLFAVLLGGATAMLPVYARDILHVGPSGLGNLRAAPAVGSTLTAIFLGVRPLRNNVGIKMLAAVCVFGAATIVFGFSTWMPLSLLALAVLGSADMVSVFIRQSLIQLYTPNEMRGRVGAISSLFISGSNELGEAESGFFAATVGPVAAVVAGGIGAIGVTLLWSRLFPELRRARTFAPPANLVQPAEETRP
ncbi:MFS transporter [Sphingomonas sp. BIUV-7]|uniref:Multidrug efflux pump Tap n=1 Tax=Sphingomonas natans TaxID=3063330 RepID=A0ABT8Y3J7_9SPHN|nr:MFS transporter [Sphingomonas sp. BIUV-7]MDO6412886.1 MFS transporter [Sphingomonas sp. BIUV-7]